MKQYKRQKKKKKHGIRETFIPGRNVLLYSGEDLGSTGKPRHPVRMGAVGRAAAPAWEAQNA